MTEERAKSEAGRGPAAVPAARRPYLRVMRAAAILALLSGAAWLLLWAFRLTRAVFLPGNLQLELHWLEVGLLLVLGLDLLIGALCRSRAMVVLPDGAQSVIRRPTVVGSGPGPGGVVVEGVQVSRRHLEVVPAPGGRLVLRDLGSTNGTFVNGADIRGRDDVVMEPGDEVVLGLSGPRLGAARSEPGSMLPPGWRFGLLMALLWVGLFLGWRANVLGLPVLPVTVGGVSVGFGLFREALPIIGVGLALSLLAAWWSWLAPGRAGSRATTVVHHGVQLLLVLGAVILYPLMPAEGLRYARLAESAERAVGAEVWASLSGTQSMEAPEDRAEPSDGQRARFRSGRRLLGLAGSLGAREGSPLLGVTYFRQVAGLVAAALLFLVLPLAWPGLAVRVRRSVEHLARPMAGARGGAFRQILYPDVLLGLLAIGIVVVTVATPFGTSLGRGKNLFLVVPGVGTVQSIELVKALFVVFMAGYFARTGRLLEVVPRARYLVPFLLAAGGALAVTAVQADMGGLLMLALLVTGMFVLGTGAWRLLAVVPVLLGLGLGLAALLDRFSIVATRYALWLDPRHHPLGEQVVNARQLLLSSGIDGFVPHRLMAWSLPDVHGDLVFVALAERYGLIGVVGLLAAWAAMVVALVAAAGREPRSNGIGALLLGGVAVLLTIQVLTQCGGALGLMPFTGVPLPWLSQGMTASVVFTAVLGLALVGAAGDRPMRGVGTALPARRVRLFTGACGALFAVILVLAAWWQAVLPLGGSLGPRGRDYRWVDLDRTQRLNGLIEAGVFVRHGATSVVRVDQAAFRAYREASGADPGLLELVRQAQGLRWRDDGIRPLPYLVSNPNRFAARALPRGWILDREGRALAMNDARGRRVYPLGEATLHAVGVAGGMTAGFGLESAAGALLTGVGLPRGMRLRAFASDIHHGADLVLTLDAGLQRSAHRALEGRRGAVVVMDLEDGALLALASSPSLSPDAVGTTGWERAASDAERPLLDRPLASTDLYSPPGSTFKMVMAAAALLHRDRVDPSEKIVCDGYDEELQVRCAHGTAHGKTDLARALTVSCNVYFGRLAVALGPDAILDTVARFGFNPEEVLDLAPDLDGVTVAVSPSAVDLGPAEIPHDRALARVGFGQGPVSATPLQMARAGAVLATGGELIEPYLVKAFGLGTVDDAGRREMVWKDRQRPDRPRDAIPGSVAKQLNRQLREVFEDERGTAFNLPQLWFGDEGWRLAHDDPGKGWKRIPVAGKTGSAWRTARDQTDDAWMVAWAPAKKPRVITCILVEDAGSGAKVAGPIAMEMLRDSLDLLEAER